MSEIDWCSKEFQDCVNKLKPYESAVRSAFALHIRGKEKYFTPTTPSLTVNGPSAHFRMVWQHGLHNFWDVEVCTVDDDVEVKVKPPAVSYPGWGWRTVCKASEPSQCAAAIRYCGAPLDMILKSRGGSGL